jgi:hypothetical protein
MRTRKIETILYKLEAFASVASWYPQWIGVVEELD